MSEQIDLFPDQALITAPVNPLPTPMPTGWTLNKVAALVLELVQEMYDRSVILKKYSLDDAQFATLEQNEFFQEVMKARTIEWNSASNTQRRLSLEAAIALEDGLPNVAARMSKPTEPLGEVVSLVKVLAEMAGAIGAKAAAQPQSATEKFKIVINLGGETLSMEKERGSLVEIHPNTPT